MSEETIEQAYVRKCAAAGIMMTEDEAHAILINNEFSDSCHGAMEEDENLTCDKCIHEWVCALTTDGVDGFEGTKYDATYCHDRRTSGNVISKETSRRHFKQFIEDPESQMGKPHEITTIVCKTIIENLKHLWCVLWGEEWK